ncbi:MAG: DUF2029 domain-containing protein [Candidatus Bathyarchaeota archaeon]|nr:DUF2029 domain-containing protein [Candidatus Bathyarchaeota archaeon]
MNNTNTKILIIVTAILLTLNLYTFIVAYPETYTLTPGISTGGDILAKDFSAYYMAAWRLWNNPSHIFTFGALGGGEPIILPHPEAYKYLPSFLLIVSPLLTLDYQQALWTFDIIQFMLLPLMAYLLYKLLENKHIAVTVAVFTIALLLPFPTAHWGLSASYYWQWGEGQAKVFQIFLLLLSFYFGSRNKPYLSGVAFAFGFFDPRFGLLAIPLYVMYNRRNLKAAVASAVGTLALPNLMLLYPGLGSGFISMVFGSGITTPLYYYSFIPLLTLLSLIVVNFKALVAAFDYKGVLAGFTGATDPKK